MMNLATLVGRIVDEPTIIERDGKSCSQLTLAVSRAYKNCEGVYETDFIPIVLWSAIAENVKEYCHKGDLVGVKGRVENINDSGIHIIADKVTFLASKKD